MNNLKLIINSFLFTPLLASSIGHCLAQDGGLKASIVADNETHVPGLQRPFDSFGPPPTIDGQEISFVGKSGASHQGIYRLAAGELTAWVDTRTPIPGGRGSFTSFESPAIARGGHLAFRAIGRDGHDGVYAIIGGKLTRVADTRTGMPNSDAIFAEFGRPAFDGRYVVFTGRGPGGKYKATYQGIYRYDTTASKLATAVDWTMWAPGKATGKASKFAMTTDNSVGKDGRVVGYARDGNEVHGLYVSDTQTAEVLVDASTEIPNRGGETFLRFDDPYFDQSFKTDNVAFTADVGEEEGSFAGVFALIGGRLITLATTQTAIPGGTGLFIEFKAVSVFRDRVFFVGLGDNDWQGIYAWSPTTGLLKLLDRGDRVGGKAIKELQISQKAVDDDQITFLALHDDGSSGIYRAELPR